MMKRQTTILKAGLLMLVALAACCNSYDTLQAQESHKKFTLTNGRLWWMDATSCDLSRKYTVAFDHQNSWANVHIYGPQYTVTHYAEQGEKYLELNISGATPVIVGRDTSAGFTPYCVWTRTGSTGYYYQEWGSYRYYLVGTPEELKVVKVGVGDALDDATYWYDWDFGCGITNVNYVNGVRKETTHWIYYDTVGKHAGITPGEWKMVPEDCYQRPEDMVYEGYTGTGEDDLTKWYYHSYQYPSDPDLMPDAQGFYHDNLSHAYGNGALYMPVTQIDHPTTIESYDSPIGASSNNNILDYTEEATINLSLNRAIGAQVRPAYTEYREEKSRCGISLNYTERGNNNTFGKAGVPVVQTYYYQNGIEILSIPDLENPSLELATVTFHMDPKLRRYLEMYGNDPDKATIHDTTLVITPSVELSNIMHVRSYSIPSSDISANLYMYLKFSYTVGGDPTTYYAFDTLEVPLTASSAVTKTEIEEPKFSPVVYGFVCGGGRMANVGWDDGSTITGGDTKITIHNTDTTYAVYGGNDIAGWVQGSATIQVGTLQTVTPLRLGYLYGGGCGYYSYSTIYDVTDDSWAADNEITDVVGYANYCFGNGTNTGKVYPWRYTLTGTAADDDYVIAEGFGYVPYDGIDFAHGEKGQGGNGTIPYIKTSHINIGVPVGYDEGSAATDAEARKHNDLVQLDTVFGGAENAFIGVDGVLGMDSRAVTLDVYGGSIMALFGGNNYGGSVASKAHTYITVESTKLADDVYAEDPATISPIENTYYTGYGRDFGIRHLYGGGNKVESAHAQVAIHGGMIDTCFLGGNMASVVQPIGTIDCRGKGFIYKNPCSRSSSPRSTMEVRTPPSTSPPTPTATSTSPRPPRRATGQAGRRCAAPSCITTRVNTTAKTVATTSACSSAATTRRRWTTWPMCISARAACATCTAAVTRATWSTTVCGGTPTTSSPRPTTPRC